jgi:hypothetical protein
MKTSKSMIAGWGLMSEAIDIPDGACNVTVLGTSAAPVAQSSEAPVLQQARRHAEFRRRQIRRICGGIDATLGQD